MQPIAREGIKVFNPKIGTKREESTTNADKALFDKIDKNKDGVIDAKEFWGHHSDLYPIFRPGIDGKSQPIKDFLPIIPMGGDNKSNTEETLESAKKRIEKTQNKTNILDTFL